MELSVIIVNWNSADYLERCLQSIQENAGDLHFEIIVVDNASFDGSDQLITKKFPGVTFIQSPENLGFAGANNLAFQRSSGRHLLFLNPDTEILGNAVRVLYTSLESIPDAGAVGCQQIGRDHCLQPESTHRFPTIFNQILDVDYRRLLPARWKERGIKASPFRKYNVREVDAVSGACIMIRRETFEKIGLFSPDYFMYSEDLDLCYKIRQSGSKIYLIQDAAIVHHGGGSSRKQEDEYLSILWMRESIFTFLEKFRGRSYARWYKISMIPVSTGRLLLTGLAVPPAFALGKEKSLWPVWRKWQRILTWSMGLRAGQNNRGEKEKNASAPGEGM